MRDLAPSPLAADLDAATPALPAVDHDDTPFSSLVPPVDADPVGTADRKAALAELASRFVIVPDDSDPAKRLPNQVTQAEFQSLANEFSDIRLGRTDLTVDTERKGLVDLPFGDSKSPLPPREASYFKQGAMNDIADILQTQSGRTLIDTVAHEPEHHKTRIALNDQMGIPKEGTATTMNDDGQTNAAIAYVPGYRFEYPSPSPWTSDFPSHVTLFHELTHAKDRVTGTRDESEVVASDGVPSDVGLGREEHQAAGLGKYAGEAVSENRYRAERALIGAEGVGAQPGDVGMPQRTEYIQHPNAHVDHSLTPEMLTTMALSQTGPDGAPVSPQEFASRLGGRGLDQALIATAQQLFGDEYAAQLAQIMK
jgi:hypothetical protein